MTRVETFEIHRDPRFFCAFPAASLLGDGRVLVVFRRARDQRWLIPEEHWDPELDQVDHVDPRSQLVALTLDPERGFAADGPPVGLPVDPEAGDQDANLIRLADGRLFLSGFAWYPMAARMGPVVSAWGGGFLGRPETSGTLYLLWGAFARISGDAGATWTPHTYLPELPGHPPIVPTKRPMHGGALRGRQVEAPDGTVFQATYLHHRWTEPAQHSHLFAARGGDPAAFRHVGPIVSADTRASYQEPALHLDRTGTLHAYHRTAGLEDRLVTARSTDGGVTWAPPEIREVIGHPYDPLPLSDGRVFLSYGYRHAPFGIRARVFDPIGDRVEDAEELVLRDDGVSPDLGYPWSVEIAPGRILCVHYFCWADGVRHIAGSLVTLDG